LKLFSVPFSVPCYPFKTEERGRKGAAIDEQVKVKDQERIERNFIGVGERAPFYEKIPRLRPLILIRVE
jgi:hypothetical protein